MLAPVVPPSQVLHSAPCRVRPLDGDFFRQGACRGHGTPKGSPFAIRSAAAWQLGSTSAPLRADPSGCRAPPAAASAINERVVQAELPRLIVQLRGVEQARQVFAADAELNRPLEGGSYFQEARPGGRYCRSRGLELLDRVDYRHAQAATGMTRGRGVPPTGRAGAKRDRPLIGRGRSLDQPAAAGIDGGAGERVRGATGRVERRDRTRTLRSGTPDARAGRGGW